MTTAKKMLQVAAKYIGVSGTDNIFNTWYYGYHCYDPERYPWCAAFASYVAMEAKLKCKYSVSAAGFANQFERIPVSREDEVQPGDIVIFNWDGRVNTDFSDHVGIVEWSTIGQNGLFGTIEGNTGGGEGTVMRVTRDNWSSYFTAFFRPKYETSGSAQTAPSTSTSAKRIFGIDVSSNQPKNVCALAKHDFAIVKMSGNPQSYAWNYINDYAGQQMKDAMQKSGCVGLYHFTWGKAAKTEAQFFIDQVKKLGYLGKCMLVIDYEAEAIELGRAWVKEFADYIKAKTGIAPVIYASGSVIVYQKLFELGYPIWCANYSQGYAEINGRSTSGCTIYGGCEKSTMWQFTSQGRVPGYDGLLDCNVFFGSQDDFKKHMGNTPALEPAPEPTPEPAPTDTGKRYRIVAKPSLRIRSKRSTSGKTVAELPYGSLVYLIDLTNEGGNTWGKIARGNHVGKYVAVKYNGNTFAKRHYSVATIAKQVIEGKWGNGQDRIKRLKKEGYDPVAVQKKVNELLS